MTQTGKSLQMLTNVYMNSGLLAQLPEQVFRLYFICRPIFSSNDFL